MEDNSLKKEFTGASRTGKTVLAQTKQFICRATPHLNPLPRGERRRSTFLFPLLCQEEGQSEGLFSLLPRQSNRVCRTTSRVATGREVWKPISAKRSQSLEVLVLVDLLDRQCFERRTASVCHLASFAPPASLLCVCDPSTTWSHLEDSAPSNSAWPFAAVGSMRRGCIWTVSPAQAFFVAVKPFRGQKGPRMRFAATNQWRCRDTPYRTGGSKCAVDGRDGWF
jgi:hypothetical protein